MASIVLNGLLLLIFISKCLAGLNVLNLVSNLTTRPLEKLLTDDKDFIEIANEYGYRAEKHQVTTDDGYILTIFRIPPGKNCTEVKKTPMLLMHGVIMSAECFADAGPDAPAFVLAEQCYDLWFGNVRGNFHSRKHVHLDPDTDSEYWQFSVNEMGLYDVPATIDYVLTATNKEKLFYLGYSQGTLTFFIMNSERPEYADKISLFIGLAPTARINYIKSVPFRAIFESMNALQHPLEAAGVWEIFSRGQPLESVLGTLCQEKLLAAVVCGLTTSLLDTPHPGSITPETEQRLYKHLLAGSSVKNLAWYGQSANSLKFLNFDYGSERNLEVYGTPHPPEYNLKGTKMPAVVFHGLSDSLVVDRDSDWCVNQLPNVLEYIIVEDPLWNHADQVYSQYWRQAVFAPMKKYLDEYDTIH